MALSSLLCKMDFYFDQISYLKAYNLLSSKNINNLTPNYVVYAEAQKSSTHFLERVYFVANAMMLIASLTTTARKKVFCLYKNGFWVSLLIIMLLK